MPDADDTTRQAPDDGIPLEYQLLAAQLALAGQLDPELERRVRHLELLMKWLPTP